MTIEELKEEKELLRERIYSDVMQFLDKTRSIGVDISGTFETSLEKFTQMDTEWTTFKRVPKITINNITLI